MYSTTRILISPLLYLISLFYGFVVRLRNYLYQKGIKKVYTSKCFVISIGNLVAGGVGKTPWTLKLASDAQLLRARIALLSRGYKSTFEHKSTPTLICEDSGPIYSPKECGDEPYLITKRLPKTPFIVGKHRTLSAQLAEKMKVSTLLLDDGFQHRKLHRDIDIVILDAKDLFGRKSFLPYGRLRDPISSLKRAHLVIVNHTCDEQQIPKLEKQILPYTSAKLIFSRFESVGFFDAFGEQKQIDKNQPVAAFCGLGQPDQFFQTLKNQGFEIIEKKVLKDHQKFESKDFLKWTEQAYKKGAQKIICTEKDWVKLDHQGDVVYQKIEPVIIKGQKYYQEFLQKTFLLSKKN